MVNPWTVPSNPVGANSSNNQCREQYSEANIGVTRPTTNAICKVGNNGKERNKGGRPLTLPVELYPNVVEQCRKLHAQYSSSTGKIPRKKVGVIACFVALANRDAFTNDKAYERAKKNAGSRRTVSRIMASKEFKELMHDRKTPQTNIMRETTSSIENPQEVSFTNVYDGATHDPKNQDASDGSVGSKRHWEKTTADNTSFVASHKRPPCGSGYSLVKPLLDV